MKCMKLSDMPVVLSCWYDEFQIKCGHVQIGTKYFNSMDDKKLFDKRNRMNS